MRIANRHAAQLHRPAYFATKYTLHRKQLRNRNPRNPRRGVRLLDYRFWYMSVPARRRQLEVERRREYARQDREVQ